MIRISKWPGLLSGASPYIIPPGASVEQVNAQSLTPGQLSVRPGSVALTFTVDGEAQQQLDDGTGMLEIWSYNLGSGAGQNAVFAMDAVGNIRRLTSLN